ncbi:MAG: PadR family transcriptional regulator [Chloroflexota bacterium]|nr:PadR family transcriptional regulator [Chloroflexota bacterium]
MPARHAILGLLLQQPLHGYDIDGEFDKGLRRICHVNISQIYAYLKSMEGRGWVESETVYQKSNPPKKVFHVTEKGRAEMERWLHKPVETNRQMRDELLTKVYFCSILSPEKLATLVEEQLEIQKAWLDDIRARSQRAEKFLQTVMLEAGLRHAEADYEWLLWLREQLQERLPAESVAGMNGQTS